MPMSLIIRMMSSICSGQRFVWQVIVYFTIGEVSLLFAFSDQFFEARMLLCRCYLFTHNFPCQVIACSFQSSAEAIRDSPVCVLDAIGALD